MVTLWLRCAGKSSRSWSYCIGMAEIDVCDSSKDTPQRVASQNGVLDIVQWLLDHEADVNTQDDSDALWTPLHNAADYGHLQVFQMPSN